MIPSQTWLQKSEKKNSKTKSWNLVSKKKTSVGKRNIFVREVERKVIDQILRKFTFSSTKLFAQPRTVRHQDRPQIENTLPGFLFNRLSHIALNYELFKHSFVRHSNCCSYKKITMDMIIK